LAIDRSKGNPQSLGFFGIEAPRTVFFGNTITMGGNAVFKKLTGNDKFFVFVDNPWGNSIDLNAVIDMGKGIFSTGFEILR
jgi:hypothetical protein